MIWIICIFLFNICIDDIWVIVIANPRFWLPIIKGFTSASNANHSKPVGWIVAPPYCMLMQWAMPNQTFLRLVVEAGSVKCSTSTIKKPSGSRTSFGNYGQTTKHSHFMHRRPKLYPRPIKPQSTQSCTAFNSKVLNKSCIDGTAWEHRDGSQLSLESGCPTSASQLQAWSVCISLKSVIAQGSLQRYPSCLDNAAWFMWLGRDVSFGVSQMVEVSSILRKASGPVTHEMQVTHDFSSDIGKRQATRWHGAKLCQDGFLQLTTNCEKSTEQHQSKIGAHPWHYCHVLPAVLGNAWSSRNDHSRVFLSSQALSWHDWTLWQTLQV